MCTFYDYHGKSLFITLCGKISKEGIQKLRKRLDYVTNSYNINNIVANVKMVDNKDILYDVLKEYNITINNT